MNKSVLIPQDQFLKFTKNFENRRELDPASFCNYDLREKVFSEDKILSNNRKPSQSQDADTMKDNGCNKIIYIPATPPRLPDNNLNLQFYSISSYCCMLFLVYLC